MNQNQDGFALYLAIGFIVLISCLPVRSARLNIASLSEARQNDRRIALDDAEASLGEAWVTLSTQFALDNTWPASASSARRRMSSPIATIASGHMKPTQPVFTPRRRASNGDRARRFLSNAMAIHIAFTAAALMKKAHAAFGLYDVSGNNLTLNRLRRY